MLALTKLWESYKQAVVNTRFIGRQAAVIAAALQSLGYLPENMKCIGFSLGSHVCGFFGRGFKELTSHTVGQIDGIFKFETFSI